MFLSEDFYKDYPDKLKILIQYCLWDNKIKYSLSNNEENISLKFFLVDKDYMNNWREMTGYNKYKQDIQNVIKFPKNNENKKMLKLKWEKDKYSEKIPVMKIENLLNINSDKINIKSNFEFLPNELYYIFKNKINKKIEKEGIFKEGKLIIKIDKYYFYVLYLKNNILKEIIIETPKDEKISNKIFNEITDTNINIFKNDFLFKNNNKKELFLYDKGGLRYTYYAIPKNNKIVDSDQKQSKSKSKEKKNSFKEIFGEKEIITRDKLINKKREKFRELTRSYEKKEENISKFKNTLKTPPKINNNKIISDSKSKSKSKSKDKFNKCVNIETILNKEKRDFQKNIFDEKNKKNEKIKSPKSNVNNNNIFKKENNNILIISKDNKSTKIFQDKKNKQNKSKKDAKILEEKKEIIENKTQISHIKPTQNEITKKDKSQKNDQNKIAFNNKELKYQEKQNDKKELINKEKIYNNSQPNRIVSDINIKNNSKALKNENLSNKIIPLEEGQMNEEPIIITNEKNLSHNISNISKAKIIKSKNESLNKIPSILPSDEEKMSNINIIKTTPMELNINPFQKRIIKRIRRNDENENISYEKNTNLKNKPKILKENELINTNELLNKKNINIQTNIESQNKNEFDINYDDIQIIRESEINYNKIIYIQNNKQNYKMQNSNINYSPKKESKNKNIINYNSFIQKIPLYNENHNCNINKNIYNINFKTEFENKNEMDNTNVNFSPESQKVIITQLIYDNIKKDILKNKTLGKEINDIHNKQKIIYKNNNEDKIKSNKIDKKLKIENVNNDIKIDNSSKGQNVINITSNEYKIQSPITKNNYNNNNIITHSNDINIHNEIKSNYNPNPNNINYNNNEIEKINEIIIKNPITEQINRYNNKNQISRESQVNYNNNNINIGQFSKKHPFNYNNENIISQQSEIIYNDNNLDKNNHQQIPIENKIVYNERISLLNQLPEKRIMDYRNNNQITQENQINIKSNNPISLQNSPNITKSNNYTEDNNFKTEGKNPQKNYHKKNLEELSSNENKIAEGNSVYSKSQNEIDPSILEQYILFKELEDNYMIEELKKENKHLKRNYYNLEREKKKFNKEKDLFLKSRNKAIEDYRKNEEKLLEFEGELKNKYLAKVNELNDLRNKLNEERKNLESQKMNTNIIDINNTLKNKQNEINNRYNTSNPNNKYDHINNNEGDIQDNDDYPENCLADIKDNDDYPENCLADIKDNNNYPENNGENIICYMDTIQNNQFMEYNEKGNIIEKSNDDKNDFLESDNDIIGQEFPDNNNLESNQNKSSQENINNYDNSKNINENDLNGKELEGEIYGEDNKGEPEYNNEENNNQKNQNMNDINNEEDKNTMSYYNYESGEVDLNDDKNIEQDNSLHKESNNENNINEINEELIIEEYNPSLGLCKNEFPNYMNSIIQCFAHISELTNSIINIDIDPNFTKDLKNLEISKNYRSFLINIFLPEKVYNVNKNPYKVYNLKNAIYTLNPLFKTSEFISIKEFLDFFITKLHEELNTKITNENIQKIINSNLYNENDALVEFLQDFTSKNNSYLSKYIYGIEKSTLYCHQCQNTFYSFNYYSYLYFNLLNVLDYKINKYKRDDIDISITDCLDYYQRTETLIGDKGIFCPSCHKLTESTSLKNIYSTKTVLIVYLDRKIDNEISEENINFIMDEVINLRDYIEYKKDKIKEKFYLGGIVLYSEDNYGNGNYKAFCKMSKNNVWYCYDDENVYPVEFKDIQNNGFPILLFYHKIFKKD